MKILFGQLIINSLAMLFATCDSFNDNEQNIELNKISATVPVLRSCLWPVPTRLDRADTESFCPHSTALDIEVVILSHFLLKHWTCPSTICLEYICFFFCAWGRQWQAVIAWSLLRVWREPLKLRAHMSWSTPPTVQADKSTLTFFRSDWLTSSILASRLIFLNNKNDKKKKRSPIKMDWRP